MLALHIFPIVFCMHKSTQLSVNVALWINSLQNNWSQHAIFLLSSTQALFNFHYDKFWHFNSLMHQFCFQINLLCIFLFLFITNFMADNGFRFFFLNLYYAINVCYSLNSLLLYHHHHRRRHFHRFWSTYKMLRFCSL